MSSKVLLFEDNPINSRLMTMFLEQSGYFVELALSPAELEHKIQKGFDVAFIDTASPALEKNALEDLMLNIKANNNVPIPPIVAVMNSAKESEIKRYLNMGMDGYIIKPISVKSLKDTIDRVRSGKAAPAPGEDVVDIERLSQTLGISDHLLLLNLFDQFFANVRKELDQMRNAAVVKDFDVIRGLAHSIKGSGRNLRLANIGKIAEEIESQSKYPSVNLDLNGLINNLESAIARVYNDFTTKYKK